MTREPPAPTVVVAVGITDRSLTQVQWAAAEAAAQGADLRIVHVLPGSLALTPLALDSCLTDPSPQAHVVARELLEQAALASWAVAPDLDVTLDVVSGPVVRALVRLGRRAGLLVIGEGAHPSRRRGERWSITHRLTAATTCPLAVVGDTRLTVQNGPLGRSPRVVVGADATTADCAFEVAFQAARRRGLPIEVVHVLTTDTPADLEGVCGSEQATRDHAIHRCGLAVAPWAAAHPEVPVRLRVEPGDPTSVLLSASRGAALLVIGGRQHLVTGRLTGHAHQVLRSSTCPTVITHTVPSAGAHHLKRRLTSRVGSRHQARQPWTPDRGASHSPLSGRSAEVVDNRGVRSGGRRSSRHRSA